MYRPIDMHTVCNCLFWPLFVVTVSGPFCTFPFVCLYSLLHLRTGSCAGSGTTMLLPLWEKMVNRVIHSKAYVACRCLTFYGCFIVRLSKRFYQLTNKFSSHFSVVCCSNPEWADETLRCNSAKKGVWWIVEAKPPSWCCASGILMMVWRSICMYAIYTFRLLRHFKICRTVSNWIGVQWFRLIWTPLTPHVG